MESTASDLPSLEHIQPIPQEPGWRKGAPNVVVIVLDDVGFAQLGCFGSDIDTPHLDRLASVGLRFTNYHTTALCSPTRASLLTGRNHHRVGVGWHPDQPVRFPGYNGRIPAEAATFPEIMQSGGWATYAVGKWHLTPREERTPVGPFQNWPTGKGFDRYYGFIGGDTNQWTPVLARDQSYVDPPARPENGYHLNKDLADQAIAYLRELRAYHEDRPFLLYYATGAAHAPHHAPREWIDRFRGRFDAGWDVWREEVLARQKTMGLVPEGTEVSPRPSWVTPWGSLSDRERRFCARTMEVFAGFLSHTDHHIGRVIDEIDATGEFDNTVFVVLSDNGASGQGGTRGSSNELRFISEIRENFDEDVELIDELGGFRTYNHYAWGWALAGNTPLQRWKKYTWEGGTRCPLILCPPSLGDNERGTLRNQYCHTIDLFPTLLRLCDIELPDRVNGVDQMSIDGIDMTPAIDDPSQPELRTTQYFELEGSRAIYHDGWKAVTNHVYQGQVEERELVEGSHDFATDHWALIDARNDFTEVNDLSSVHPEVVERLQRLWWHEAGRNGVLPLFDHTRQRFEYADQRFPNPKTRVVVTPDRDHWVPALPVLTDQDFNMTLELSGPLGEGVLLELGDWTSGFAFIVRDGRVSWLFNVAGHGFGVHGQASDQVEQLELQYRADGTKGGDAALVADGTKIAEARLEQRMPFVWSISGNFLRVGRGDGFPVSDDYANPWPYTGIIRHFTLTVGSPAIGLTPEQERRHLERSD
ncbi:MAG: arylsulfatase [bacterium]|nr:arylsulfatase [bacterium]